MIYFARYGRKGQIKIGHAVDLQNRVRNLSSSCPRRIYLLGVMEGDEAVEATLHARFRRHLYRAEWFTPHKEILDFIAANTRRVDFATTNGNRRDLRTFVGIVSQWERVEDLAADLSVTANCVRMWETRNRIPRRHWSKIVESAAYRGFPGISLERLEKIAQARDGKMESCEAVQMSEAA